MVDSAIIMTPNEFDRLAKQIRDQITTEIESIKGLVVEKPLTMKQAAAFLGLSVSTLKRQILVGMPSHRIGGSIMFFPSELVAYIKSKKR